MNSFALLADPVRRRIVEVLADGEQAVGSISQVVQSEFDIGQPAVSNQLKLLREGDIVSVRPDGSRRIYSLTPGAFDDITAWVERYSRLWLQRLDALETELARGRRSPTTTPTQE